VVLIRIRDDLGSNLGLEIGSPGRFFRRVPRSRQVDTEIVNESRPRLLLCGLVVRVSGYGSRGTGFDARRYQIF
jgi:hypothetical protein